jgi:hypothetical protein
MMRQGWMILHVPSLSSDVILSHDCKPAAADLLQTRAP